MASKQTTAIPPEAADLKKSYADAVTRAGRFVLTSLIILVTLTFVVEQEIRERARDEGIHSRQARERAGRLRASKQELSGDFLVIEKFLKERRSRDNKQCVSTSRELLEPDDILDVRPAAVAQPETSASRADLVAVARLNRGLKRARSAASEKATKGKEYPYQSLCDTLGGIPEPVLSVRESADLAKLQAQGPEIRARLAKLQESREKEGDKKRGADKTLIGLVNDAIEKVAQYEKSYRQYSDAAQKHLATVEELKKINSVKGKVPTPFGNFEIQPALAMLAIAFSAFLTYFIFQYSVWHIRSLAAAYKSLHPRGRPVTDHDSAPFWLYSADADRGRALTFQRRHWVSVALSFALHASWIWLAYWLASECLFRWGSTSMLYVGRRGVITYLFVACFVIAVALAVWQFGSPLLRPALRWASVAANPFGKIAGAEQSKGRRNFVRGAAAFLVVAAAGGAVYAYLRSRLPKVICKRLPARDYFSLLGPQQPPEEKPSPVKCKGPPLPPEPLLVVNRNTRIAHHSELCRGHLPKEHNRAAEGEAAARDALLHCDYQIRMLEQQADAIIEEHRCGLENVKAGARLAIPILEKAVELSPYSFRLYDKLRKQYGYLKRYDAIHESLRRGRQTAEQELATLDKLPKTGGRSRREEKLKRTMSVFEGRAEKAKLRACEAPDNSAEADARIKERKRARQPFCT